MVESVFTSFHMDFMQLYQETDLFQYNIVMCSRKWTNDERTDE